jgi:hypothetical protein
MAGTHVGRFWIAEHPEHSLIGRLTVGPGIRPTVEVHGLLVPWLRVVSQRQSGDQVVTTSVPIDPLDQTDMTVHGELFELNRKVTVVQVRPGDLSQRHGGLVLRVVSV